MKHIPLTQGKHALVDDIDYNYLNQWKWFCRYGYAIRMASQRNSPGNSPRNSPRKSLCMHRVVAKRAGIDCSQTIDHINLDKLDNRRKSLRAATQAQQTMNVAARKDSTSGFKGVCYHKRNHKWLAQIAHNGKRHHLGLFTNKLEAAKAYNEAAIKYFGEFARLNTI